VLAASLVFAASAHAQIAHTVEPGETLWSIAAASNLTTRALAAANGISEDAQVQSGTTIQVPSEQEAAAALAGAGPQPVAPSSAGAGAPGPLGAYTVRPGDTLSGIAARSGIGVGQLAWMNGLDRKAPLLTDSVLKLPTGSPLASEAPPAPVESAVVPDADPQATPGRVTAAQVGGVAAANGVPPSLASAVAWQESGFNNGVVSRANARGVMQLLPGTWSWVEEQLVGHQLDGASPLENVHAGVLYLGQLLKDAGGDETRAVASYYQGAESIRRAGLLPETRHYVQNVMALRSRFGGP
jgi:soluble lytic murein transglycosylase-like protein